MRGADAPFPRRPTLISMVGAMVGVLACFLLVTLIGQHYATRIDDLAGVLGTNVMPSVGHLTAARGALHGSSVEIRKLSDEDNAGRVQSHHALENKRGVLDREFAEYMEIPFFPGERALAATALKDIGAYELALAKITQTASAGQPAKMHLLTEDAISLNERVDADLERLVSLNAVQGSRTSTGIQRARMWVTKLSYLLHALGGILAFLVLWAVVRARRTYERAIESRATLESQQKRLAEERAAELDMFGARVAHGLKNPLSAATLLLSALDYQLESAGQARAIVQRLQRAHRAMQRIIDGLLAFSRSSTCLEPTSTDLGDLLQEALADLAPAIDRTGVKISVIQDRPVRVACASGPLLSVLENLLGNATKYIVAVPPEARHIQVRITEDKAVVRVEIDDTGPGIPPDVQKDIFDPYVRGRDTTQPGLGLGLATVKRIIEAYGGTVGVRSVVGSGSCFFFELPHAVEPKDEEARLQLN